MSDYDKLAHEAWNVWDLDRLMANEPNEITAAKITKRVAAAIAAAEERGRRAGIEEAALAPDEAVKRLTAAMREADRLFEQVGGSTRHHVRDCLLPILEKHGLLLIAALAPRDSGKGDELRAAVERKP
jgi:hypothetical protein